MVAPPLTQAGIRSLVEKLRQDPKKWDQAVALLRSNPRRGILVLFGLTATQRAILYGIPDGELSRYTRVILRSVSKLERGEGRIVFEPDPVFAGRKEPHTAKTAAKAKVSCSCHITIEF